MSFDFSDMSPHISGYLDGKILVAMPGMQDERFARSVVYVCAHSEEGAMGLVVNQPVRHLQFPQLLNQLGIKQNFGVASGRRDHIQILNGGPVESGRGFVLHSGDVTFANSTLAIEDNICLTATLDILHSIASGEGPEQAILALGYAGWSAGQLEQEIHANGWLHCDADRDIVFDDNTATKYERALRLLGIAPGMLSSDAGHA